MNRLLLLISLFYIPCITATAEFSPEAEVVLYPAKTKGQVVILHSLIATSQSILKNIVLKHNFPIHFSFDGTRACQDSAAVFLHEWYNAQQIPVAQLIGILNRQEQELIRLRALIEEPIEELESPVEWRAPAFLLFLTCYAYLQKVVTEDDLTLESYGPCHGGKIPFQKVPQKERKSTLRETLSHMSALYRMNMSSISEKCINKFIPDLREYTTEYIEHKKHKALQKKFGADFAYEVFINKKALGLQKYSHFYRSTYADILLLKEAKVPWLKLDYKPNLHVKAFDSLPSVFTAYYRYSEEKDDYLFEDIEEESGLAFTVTVLLPFGFKEGDFCFSEVSATDFILYKSIHHPPYLDSQEPVTDEDWRFFKPIHSQQGREYLNEVSWLRLNPLYDKLQIFHIYVEQFTYTKSTQGQDEHQEIMAKLHQMFWRTAPDHMLARHEASRLFVQIFFHELNTLPRIRLALDYVNFCSQALRQPISFLTLRFALDLIQAYGEALFAAAFEHFREIHPYVTTSSMNLLDVFKMPIGKWKPQSIESVLDLGSFHPGNYWWLPRKKEKKVWLDGDERTEYSVAMNWVNYHYPRDSEPHSKELFDLGFRTKGRLAFEQFHVENDELFAEGQCPVSHFLTVLDRMETRPSDLDFFQAFLKELLTTQGKKFALLEPDERRLAYFKRYYPEFYQH